MRPGLEKAKPKAGAHLPSRGKGLREFHGEAPHGRPSPEYTAWLHMRHRCLNPRDQAYVNYGARGISVCISWASFATFLRDMGRRPSAKHTLERVDNDKGYAPGNVVWATRQTQNQNSRHVRWTHKDVRTMRALHLFGVSYCAISRMYDADDASIRRICIGRYWSNVT